MNENFIIGLRGSNCKFLFNLKNKWNPDLKLWYDELWEIHLYPKSLHNTILNDYIHIRNYRLFRIICSMISSFEGWKHVGGITCIYKLMFYFFKTCLSLIKSCLSQIKGSGLLKLHGSDWKAMKMKKSWWMSTKCTL